jgi:hypothetical protein
MMTAEQAKRNKGWDAQEASSHPLGLKLVCGHLSLVQRLLLKVHKPV